MIKLITFIHFLDLSIQLQVFSNQIMTTQDVAVTRILRDQLIIALLNNEVMFSNNIFVSKVQCFSKFQNKTLFR